MRLDVGVLILNIEVLGMSCLLYIVNEARHACVNDSICRLPSWSWSWHGVGSWEWNSVYDYARPCNSI